MSLNLSDQERSMLDLVAQTAKPRYVRRAKLLLACTAERDVDEACAQSGLSARTVRYWLERFDVERMQVFPPSVLWEASADPSGRPADVSVCPDIAITPQALLQQQGLEEEQGGHVADLADQLWSLTQQVHHCEPSWRDLLHKAALLHDVGLAQSERKHDRVGAEQVSTATLAGLTEVEQRYVAGLVWLHDNEAPPKRCDYFRGLGAQRQAAWTAAAILRLAAALDTQRSHATSIVEVQPTERGLCIVLEGPTAIQDAASAAQRTALWDDLYDCQLDFCPSLFVSSVEEEAKQQLIKELDLKSPGISPTDSMAEAGRKVLYFHFLRMVRHEEGTRRGEDIEALHDMRVATRRMRAAFRIFCPYFRRKQIASFQKDLRRAGAYLGAVRDLDVFLEKAAAYAETLPEADRPSLTPLVVEWRAQRERERRKMLSYLDSDGYRDFCRDFGAFLQTEGAAVKKASDALSKPTLVAHLVPVVIYQRLAEVRAFGPYLEQAPLETYHELRIYFKRLRYTLEFFQEVLGPSGTEIIERVTAMQDYLGELQDACVATDMLRGFLNQWAEREKREWSVQRIDIHSVTQYLAAQQARIHALLAGFPQAWAAFDDGRVRQALAQALSVL